MSKETNDLYVLHFVTAKWQTREDLYSHGLAGLSDRTLTESLRRLITAGKVEVKHRAFNPTVYRTKK